jgi:hypothetical protein
MSVSEIDAHVDDNRAEVMMAAGLGFARAGDRKTATSFFADAAHLFREKHDYRSANLAQAWVDAAKRPVTKAALQQASCLPGDN